MKEDVPKLFQQLVTISAKEKILENMTKFQIATKPGHRATEHVFCVLSLIQLSEMNGSSLLLSLFDIEKFFDKEAAVDVHYELYKSDVKGKIYRLLYLLNPNIRIKVRTPVGLTEAADTGPGIGQGTVPGAIVSAAGLDNGVKEVFHEDEEDDSVKMDDDISHQTVKYDDIPIHPLLFQDDLFSASNSVEGAQQVNLKMEHLME